MYLSAQTMKRCDTHNRIQTPTKLHTQNTRSHTMTHADTRSLVIIPPNEPKKLRLL